MCHSRSKEDSLTKFRSGACKQALGDHRSVQKRILSKSECPFQIKGGRWFRLQLVELSLAPSARHPFCSLVYKKHSHLRVFYLFTKNRIILTHRSVRRIRNSELEAVHNFLYHSFQFICFFVFKLSNNKVINNSFVIEFLHLALC